MATLEAKRKVKSAHYWAKKKQENVRIENWMNLLSAFEHHISCWGVIGKMCRKLVGAYFTSLLVEANFLDVRFHFGKFFNAIYYKHGSAFMLLSKVQGSSQHYIIHYKYEDFRKHIFQEKNTTLTSLAG